MGEEQGCELDRVDQGSCSGRVGTFCIDLVSFDYAHGMNIWMFKPAFYVVKSARNRTMSGQFHAMDSIVEF